MNHYFDKSHGRPGELRQVSVRSFMLGTAIIIIISCTAFLSDVSIFNSLLSLFRCNFQMEQVVKL